MPKIVIKIKRKHGSKVITLKINNQVVYVILFFVCCFQSQAAAINSKVITENAQPLRIAVAANFTPVLKKLLIDFKAQTGIDSQIISGASGAMYLQLKHGAPFDIFLSADSRRPKALEQENLILPNSRKTYATGQLALYNSQLAQSKPPQRELHQQNFLQPEVKQEHDSLANFAETALKKVPKRFAIANPSIAPYGKAAQETLVHLNLWQPYSKVLIKGINISQTFAQIRSKSVSSGLVSQSQLVLNNLQGHIIPSHFHQPITQQLVILKHSKNSQKANKLSEFLLSPAIQKVIVSYGYLNTETTLYYAKP
jgi:molybdate transport system substrate-binding protein